jgi:hypothetical protein
LGGELVLVSACLTVSPLITGGQAHTHDEAFPSPGFYTGPPPSTLTYSAPDIPPANVLAQRIILSRDRLFFISHTIGSGDICKWHLVCVAFETTMSLYSSCLVDGRYLVDFYIAHPSDSWYNAINK